VHSVHVLIILFAYEKATLKYGVYASLQEQFLPLPENLLVFMFKGFHNSVDFQSCSLLQEQVFRRIVQKIFGVIQIFVNWRSIM
jgi:hypothetical protein